MCSLMLINSHKSPTLQSPAEKSFLLNTDLLSIHIFNPLLNQLHLANHMYLLIETVTLKSNC